MASVIMVPVGTPILGLSIADCGLSVPNIIIISLLVSYSKEGIWPEGRAVLTANLAINGSIIHLQIQTIKYHNRDNSYFQ